MKNRGNAAENPAPPAVTPGPPVQAPPVQKAQVFAIYPDLMSDIRDALRTLPHKDVDNVIQRLSRAQVLEVDVAPAQVPGGLPGQ